MGKLRPHISGTYVCQGCGYRTQKAWQKFLHAHNTGHKLIFKPFKGKSRTSKKVKNLEMKE